MELKEYLSILAKRKWLIAAIVLLACVATGIKSFMYTTPIYQASAKLIVNQAFDFQGTSMLDLSTMQTNITVINSYKEIIQSYAILNKVSTNFPDLKMSADELRSGLSIGSSAESQVMDLSFVSTSYPQAAKAVNAIAETFRTTNPDIMKVDNVTILNKADVEAAAYSINTSPIVLIFIAFVFSFMIAVSIVILLHYLDDTIKTERDIEKELELPMLALITKIDKYGTRSKKPSASKPKPIGEGSYATLNQ
ncbi:YveK family protein [Paenibacillus pasadenensis]|uniref:YveK family protein n=1 Tax=Paenibacillus pasadenensis TaxID=217090 RepID=UPI0004137B94|nr:Wzz/FepE/Etk N-terminal domain-containing protein [Paenibacillus pasadenensis]